MLNSLFDVVMHLCVFLFMIKRGESCDFDVVSFKRTPMPPIVAGSIGYSAKE